MSEQAETSKRLWIDGLLVPAITLGVCVLVLRTGLSPLDDYSMLRDNPLLNPPTWEGLRIQMTQPQFSIFAPLTYTIWHVIAALSYSDGKLPISGFKIASLLAHLGTALAGWWVLWLIVRNRLAAIIGGLATALHPLMIESLAWTTGLKDELCGGLSFLTIGLYVRHLQTGRGTLRRWAILTAFLATCAKPTAMVLPATLLAADWLLTDRTWRRRWLGIWPFIPVAMICAIIMLNIQDARNAPDAPLWFRPFVAGDALAFYLWKTVWPVHLSVDYARLTTVVRDSGAFAWTWIVPVAMLALIAGMRSRPLWLAAVLFVAPLSPVLGLIPFDMQQYSTVADHYAYQSMLGAGLAIAWLIARVSWTRWIAGAGVMGLIVLSWNRLTLWADQPALFAEALRVAPRSVVACGSLTILAFDRYDLADAEHWARKNLSIREDVVAYDNLATALQGQGRLSEAAQYARHALETKTDRIKVPRLRQILRLSADLKDSELARLTAERWLAIEPDHPVPTQVLARINADSAIKIPATRPEKP